MLENLLENKLLMFIETHCRHFRLTFNSGMEQLPVVR